MVEENNKKRKCNKINKNQSTVFNYVTYILV